MFAGGLSEFNVLHPSLCEIGLPVVRQSLTPSGLRASTPGMREMVEGLERVEIFVSGGGGNLEMCGVGYTYKC